MKFERNSSVTLRAPPCVVAAFSTILLFASAALGQPASTASPPPTGTVVPPSLLSDATVPYPEGATGDATVTLTVTVNVDGTVRDAVPAEPNEPFSSRAVRDALHWRFQPATRDGRSVAAKIRLEVAFRSPAAPPETKPDANGEPSPASMPAAPAPPAAAPPPIEVTVRGERSETSRTATISRAEVRQLPGAFGDPFRAIEALPGVTPIVSGLPFFYVRGAPPGNIGYFIDGVKVPYLFHVAAGPSVIHPGLVDHVDLYSGGYPARFGRFAGGIVSAETVTPRTDLHGEGNVRLFDAGALVETGFAGDRGTALVGGRYSYTGALLSLIAKDTTLGYRDYQARISYDITPVDRVTLLSFGSYDLVSQNQNNIENVLFASEFYRLDLRYDHRFGADTTIRAAVTLGFDQTRIPDEPRNSRDSMASARVELSHMASSKIRLRGGADATFEAYRADARPYADPADPDTQRFNSLFPARNDLTLGAWADAVLVFDGWEITPGARVDLYQSGGATAVAVDPRVATRFRLARNLHVMHAFGIAHQPPAFLIPIPGLAIGNLQGGLQRSIQSSASVEMTFPEETAATVTVFDNIFQNMSDTLSVNQQRGLNDHFQEPRSDGSAVGVEFYLRRKLTRRLGGYLSYTLSRSTRSVGNEHFISAFDRPHVANAAVAFDLGRRWRAGARFTIYSGTPVIAPGGGGLIPPPRSLHPDRDPTFYRLDLRLEKRWDLSKTVWLSFVAEMMNATLHTEVVQGQTIGPVSIPSIGAEGAF